jgi:predicted TPR repeat methyltransferase
MNEVNGVPETVTIPITTALHIALTLHQGGLRDEAEMLYRQVLEASPDNLDALNYLSFICHRQKRREEAAQLIERVIALSPLNADAHNNLGNVYETMGEDGKAEALFRRAIELDPQHAQAHNNLGVTLAGLGNYQEAIAVYRQAIELAPGTGEFSYNLGNALCKTGEIDAAIESYFAATKANPDHFGSWQGLARILRQAGRAEEAVQVFDNLIQLKPGDPVFPYLRAACLGDAAPDRAPDNYVTNLFDDAADTFDRHLENLEYRGPALLAETLAGALPEPGGQLSVLDAGCGTGLCGPILRPYAAGLVGVDLSEGMLKVAADRQVYDELYLCELTRFLEQQDQVFDLIVSSDTLCYFGRLDQVFQGAARSLKPGGSLYFTLEGAGEGIKDFHLESSGRYRHATGHVRQMLRGAGFMVHVERDVVLRKEAKEPVSGLLMLARKAEV